MFKYNLYTHKPEGQTSFPGVGRNIEDAPDAIQQSGDAVVWIFPYSDPDTFNFQTQKGKDVQVIEGGETKNASPQDLSNRAIVTEQPIELDKWLSSLQVMQTKDNHQGTLQAQVLDPTDDLLASCSPGDPIVCWMFDNHNDAEALRSQLRKGNYYATNGFNSGLKFVGKVFSVRKNVAALPNGGKIRRITVLATSFSELDSSIYFDPQLATNFFSGLQFMQTIGDQLNKLNGHPSEVSLFLSEYLTVFMGVGLKGNSQLVRSQQSRPLLVAPVVGTILGEPQASYYIDILRTQIGIQKYANEYVPTGLGTSTTVQQTNKTSSSPYPTIRFCPTALVGWQNPQVQPFNNVPIWSILENTSNTQINEMYTTLRMNEAGDILPHLIIRQIPFNTDDFAENFPDIPATPFRQLPRWKVEDPMINSYSVGKSDSLRINFVRVQGLAFINMQESAAAIRASVPPTSDIVDIERNGLRAYVTAINSTLDREAEISTQNWTYTATDRLMGGHLKYSGTIQLAGCQEPICVGDNLEYDDLIFHIESVTHSLQVDGMTGRKSFSTALAISNGVPATGPVFPEILNRGTETTRDKKNTVVGSTFNETFSGRVRLTNQVTTNGQEDDS